jgi:hypothetical protein
MDGKEMLQKYVVVEGHRDVYEQLYRTSVGEKSPVRDAIAPRLIRDGINLCVYAMPAIPIRTHRTPGAISKPPSTRSISFWKRRRAPKG